MDPGLEANFFARFPPPPWSPSGVTHARWLDSLSAFKHLDLQTRSGDYPDEDLLDETMMNNQLVTSHPTRPISEPNSGVDLVIDDRNVDLGLSVRGSLSETIRDQVQPRKRTFNEMIESHAEWFEQVSRSSDESDAAQAAQQSSRDFSGSRQICDTRSSSPLEQFRTLPQNLAQLRSQRETTVPTTMESSNALIATSTSDLINLNREDIEDADDDEEYLQETADVFQLAAASETWTSDDLYRQLGLQNRDAGANMITALHGKIGMNWASEKVLFKEAVESDDPGEDPIEEYPVFSKSFHFDFFSILGEVGKSICPERDQFGFSTERTTITLEYWSQTLPQKERKALPFPTNGCSFKFGYTKSSNIQWYMLARPKRGLSSAQDHQSTVLPEVTGSKGTAISIARAEIWQTLFQETLTKTPGLEATLTQDGEGLKQFTLSKSGFCDLSYKMINILLKGFFHLWEQTLGSLRDPFFQQVEPCVFCFGIGGNIEVDVHNSNGLLQELNHKFNLRNADIFSYDLAVNISTTSEMDPALIDLESQPFSLLGNKAELWKEYPDRRLRQEIRFFPMAWSPEAVSLQTKHVPRFFERGFLRPCNEKLNHLSRLTHVADPLFSRSTQMYSILSHNVRHRPQDFKMASGSHVGGLCNPLDDSMMKAKECRTRNRLQARIEDGKHFSQLIQSVEQAIEQEHFGYRIEIRISVRLQSVDPLHRNFEFIHENVICPQMEYWSALERDMLLKRILLRFSPKVWPGVLIPINHGFQCAMRLPEQEHRRSDALSLGSREVVSILERLSASSFTGDQRFPMRIWRQLGILKGIQMRGFPSINANVLNIWNGQITTELWPLLNDTCRPVQFSHLRAISYHYGIDVWAQCLLQSKLDFCLLGRGPNKELSLSDYNEFVSTIVVEQMIPELCGAFFNFWERRYLHETKQLRTNETRGNLRFRTLGLPDLASGNSQIEDERLLKEFFLIRRQEDDLDWDWTKVMLDTVTSTREDYHERRKRMKLQIKVLALLEDATLVRPGAVTEQRVCPLSKDMLEMLLGAFFDQPNENTNFSLGSITSREYCKRIATIALKQGLLKSNRPPMNIKNIKGVTLKGMTWLGSLSQLVASKGSNHWVLSVQNLAEMLEDVISEEGIKFVIGYHRGKVSAGQFLRVLPSTDHGPAGLYDFDASKKEESDDQVSDPVIQVQTRFGLHLEQNILPDVFLRGKKMLMEDLYKTPSKTSEQLAMRFARIFDILDLRDVRHLHLMAVGQLLFLHRPPPEVKNESVLKYTFEKHRPGAYNPRWLAAFVALGLTKLHADRLMSLSESGEGDPKQVITKIGKYHITARLLMHAGLLDDGGKSGQLKNFNAWKFVDQSISQLAIFELRERSRENLLSVLLFVWPRPLADSVMESID